VGGTTGTPPFVNFQAARDQVSATSDCAAPNGRCTFPSENWVAGTRLLSLAIVQPFRIIFIYLEKRPHLDCKVPPQKAETVAF